MNIREREMTTVKTDAVGFIEKQYPETAKEFRRIQKDQY